MDGGATDGATDAPSEADVFDCGLPPTRACAACIGARCCAYEHGCEPVTPRCVAYGQCRDACYDDAAACDCYVAFPDLVALEKARGECEVACVDAGLCN